MRIYQMRVGGEEFGQFGVDFPIPIARNMPNLQALQKEILKSSDW